MKHLLFTHCELYVLLTIYKKRCKYIGFTKTFHKKIKCCYKYLNYFNQLLEHD